MLKVEILNLMESISMGLNPAVGITNYKPTANAAVHPSEFSK